MARILYSDEIDRDGLRGDERDWVYNALDCAVTLEILHELRPQLDELSAATYGFSLALQGPVLEMALRGLRVDFARRDKVLNEIRADIVRLAANLDKIVRDGIGTNINWRSPKQLNILLYGVLGLPAIRRRAANGGFSPTVNRDALERLAANYFLAEPICNHLLALRDLDKQRMFLESEVDNDGRIRTGPNIAGTKTGRLSCSLSDFGTGANLQTVDPRLRSVFIADDGCELANLDLEQADSRNVGAICWNLFVESHGPDFAGAYLDACESGDLHSRVSEMVWPGVDPLTIFYRSFTHRFMSKKLGHGTNFFGQPKHMASQAKVAVPLIEEFQRNYFAAFPAIGVFDKNDHSTDCWHNHVRREIRNSSQLTTLLGRRRFFYGRYNDEETIRSAIAYEPQSLTADEINQGMLALWRAGGTELLLQVHDSILFQYPKDRRDEVLPKALSLLNIPIPLARDRDFSVPVEAKIGTNWGDFDEQANPHGLRKWKH